ncbi:MAG TPA: EamA family transporter, partial [Terriglobales bacterium]|nr:EamA family transporter [Terriglobales bacterium]
MKSGEASEIRSLLQSDQLSDIGGAKSLRPGAPSASGLVAAFAAVYLIWGSTYLAIRYAVETFPPLLMMGLRHLSAGALLYGWARWRGIRAPKLREWVHPALIGGLLFLGGHGSLAWAEQRVPSGIAALLVATLPMWIVLLARVAGIERHLSGRAVAGLVLGFGGVAVLFGPDVLRHNGEPNLEGASAVLLGTFVWSAGTIYMRSVRMPDSPAMSSAMQMFAGGVALVIAATVSGEAASFRVAAVSAR